MAGNQKPYITSKKAQNLVISIVAIFCAILLSVFQAFSNVHAYAKDGGIMDELAGMTVDGKAFNASDYPANAEGVPQLVNLYEGGYSFYADKQDRYGLLLYIYNPSQIDVKDDVRNVVQITTGEANTSNYKLKLLEVSADKLFCKFQVDFKGNEKTELLSTLNRDGRRYDVNTIEIYVSGTNATSYPIERAFTYTGYEKGYGADGSDSTINATLSYTVEGGTETIPLETKHTTWRPDGSKQGAGKYVQDSIHSVYFAVPNEYAEMYDYLNSVKVEWLEAFTAPIFVTGNAEIYEAVRNLIDFQTLMNPDPYGKAPAEFDFSNFDYGLAGGVEVKGQGSFNCELSLGSLYIAPQTTFSSNKILNALFWDILVEGNAKDYTMSSNEVLNYVNTFRPFMNDKKVGGKYPSYLFESWANEKHTEVIPVGREYELTSEKVVQEYWYEKVFGISHIENKKDFKACAIQKVRSITENSEADCANYYIGESDYEEFKAFYKANEANSTIYLLRFATSDYTQMQVYTIGKKQDGLGAGVLRDFIDENAYFAQSKVFLDFDIIYLDYVKDDKHYVLPVDMSPIDIFPNITPPVYWDEPVSDFWKYGCAMIAGLIVVYAVYRVVLKTVKEKK